MLNFLGTNSAAVPPIATFHNSIRVLLVVSPFSTILPCSLQAEKALHDAGGSLDSVDALDRLLHDVSAAATAVQMCLPGGEESTRVLRPLMSRRVYKRGETLVNQGEGHFQSIEPHCYRC